MKSDTKTTFNIDMAELMKQLGEAYSRGGTEARTQLDSLRLALESRELTIKSLYETIAGLQARFNEQLERMKQLTAETSQVVLLNARRDLAIEQLKLSSKRDTEVLNLLEEPMKRVVARFTSEGGGEPVPQGVRSAFGKIFDNEPLCAELQRVVGNDDWQAVCRWTAKLG